LARNWFRTFRNYMDEDNIIAADLRADVVERLSKISRAVTLDALDVKSYTETVKKYNINRIYNLVALLSATGEKNPSPRMEYKYGSTFKLS